MRVESLLTGQSARSGIHHQLRFYTALHVRERDSCLWSRQTIGARYAVVLRLMRPKSREGLVLPFGHGFETRFLLLDAKVTKPLALG